VGIVQVAGVLLGGGAGRRFGSDKLVAELHGERLVDIACRHFREGGLSPVVFAGRLRPHDRDVVVVEPGATMIETLRAGLAALGDGPFAFAPADMPRLRPELIAALRDAFLASGKPYLVPVHGGRRGHPAFAARKDAFLRLGETDGPREVWREAGPALLHLPVDTPDVLLDVDTPDDLAALE
jgi:CTP:molybdopterin cytidylyltransferase MocA